ncbi:MAG: hypothetical protein KC766_30325, partial [Myxococcales bacterium]|nr:hypothetical protein [Myxococcales bacterium]
MSIIDVLSGTWRPGAYTAMGRDDVAPGAPPSGSSDQAPPRPQDETAPPAPPGNGHHHDHG